MCIVQNKSDNVVSNKREIKLYFSAGCIGDDVRLIRNKTNILMSYFYITKNRTNNFKYIKDLLIDSGGFTAIKKGKKINVVDYAGFLNENNIHKAFTLDVGNLEESKYNLKYLENNTNTEIIQIYHPSEYFNQKYREGIKKYSDNYPYIGIGGLIDSTLKKRFKIEFLNYVFSVVNKNKLHGLGVSNKLYLKSYPFYSVDFTTWLNVRKYGCSVIPGFEKLNKTTDEILDDEIQYFIK